MKLLSKPVVSLAILFLAGTLQAADITGAGASFPYPLYAKWADAYKTSTSNKINYQSIGSSGGIKQIQAKTVDFGASDAPMKPEELAKSGLIQFPTVIGGVVPIVNVQGVAPGKLRLSGPVLADIYMGKISKWNDPQITKLNPSLKLPDQKINVVHRADGSGTSFIFTHFLTQVSPTWASSVGAQTAVNWPVGVGGKGNEGVASYVSRIKGSIGYVEYAYAKQNKVAYVSVQNQAGKFVLPSEASFKAAAANAKWSADNGYYMILTNQKGEQSWPIAGATFILMHKQSANAANSLETLKFFDWAYKNGDQTAKQLDYVTMPESVKTSIRNSWKQVQSNNQAIWK